MCTPPPLSIPARKAQVGMHHEFPPVWQELSHGQGCGLLLTPSSTPDRQEGPILTHYPHPPAELLCQPARLVAYMMPHNTHSSGNCFARLADCRPKTEVQITPQAAVVDGRGCHSSQYTPDIW